MKDLIIGGTYQHFKGNFYTVIGVTKHSETLEELVIYQAQYGGKSIWGKTVKYVFGFGSCQWFRDG